ncbi:hypothetical protein lerEdw1_002978 [Lerista edwardsae]|nr:hypothetical protein lerEdw1_002978 [Lerista edwardsae]
MARNSEGNPFEGDLGNPFQDPAVVQHRPTSDYATLDVYNPFESQGESTAAATADLLKRQEELNRKAEELDRRERELQNAALGSGGARPNNWPPLPAFCPVKPCFYQDIPVEIPVESQKTVTIMYYLWMGNAGGDPWIGLGPAFLTHGRHVSPQPALSDSSFNFFVFFFIFFVQDIVYVLQAIGIPGWGFSGWILSLTALKENTGVAVFMMLVAMQFTAVAAMGIVMLKRIHSLYRRTGASFQKAQEEFAAGVFSNPTMRSAAANAATGAAGSAFRAS